MGSVRSGGCDLYYQEAGQGVPILLIPPAGAIASTWGPVTEQLARIGRVIAYDRRGYARTGGAPVRLISTHTADAAAILEYLQTAPAVVVGTSAGATIAVDLAVRRPDLVQLSSPMRPHGARVVTSRTPRSLRPSPRSDGKRCAADMATPPRRYCAPPTPTATVERRGTPFPKSGGRSPGKTLDQPCWTSETPSATIHQRQISPMLRSPSSAATAHEAPTRSSA
jgi:pimeloyl-ACP methyl ester carboxylesterase